MMLIRIRGIHAEHQKKCIPHPTLCTQSSAVHKPGARKRVGDPSVPIGRGLSNASQRDTLHVVDAALIQVNGEIDGIKCARMYWGMGDACVREHRKEDEEGWRLIPV